MASSPYVYDVAIDHAKADGAAAHELAASFHTAGMRLWLPGRSAPRAELGSAMESSYAAVEIVGSASLRPAELSPCSVLVLVPGSPVTPRDVARSASGAIVVDFRDGFADARRLSDLHAAITHQSGHAGPGLRPALGHAELKIRTASSYDSIAEKFSAQWFDHPPVQPLEMFAGLLPRSANVLDAGCGPGHHAKFLAEHGHNVVGVDISANMVRIARARVAAAQFLRMDMQALRFSPASFDGIWCAGAAMHIPREEIVSVFRGFRRLVRHGGVVGINMQVGRRSEIVELGDDRRFFEYYRTEQEIVRLARRAGLHTVAVDIGTTGRNTHDLDMRLTWATLLTVKGA